MTTAPGFTLFLPSSEIINKEEKIANSLSIRSRLSLQSQKSIVTIAVTMEVVFLTRPLAALFSMWQIQETQSKLMRVNWYSTDIGAQIRLKYIRMMGRSPGCPSTSFSWLPTSMALMIIAWAELSGSGYHNHHRRTSPRPTLSRL